MTSVADTRLLLTLQFPPDQKVSNSVQAFIQKEIRQGILLPSVVLSEFIKIAGSRIGIHAAVKTIDIMKERGARVMAINEDLAVEAGRLLLKHRNVPLADSLVAAFSSSNLAEYVLSDDPHFKILGRKTKWFS